MPKYIERDALEVTLNHRLNFLMAENGEYDHYTSGFDEAVTRVENFPAADVAPVRHGRWIAPFLSDSGNMCAECSNCHKIRIFDDYCSACGAIMDLNDMED